MEKRFDVNFYDYDLPEELIAQTPLNDRSSSKLLLLNKNTGELKDDVFSNITKYFKKGDVLVLNDTRVIPARLIGEKEDTKAVIEILLLKNIEGPTWECLARPGKRLHVGSIVTFGNGELKTKVIKKKEEGIVEVELIYEGILYEILDRLGSMPLPPYIHESLSDSNRYQTVYAANPGSAAAPTAGLHFTKKLLSELESIGVIITYVTLHVGLGTFRPVNVDNILNHDMHSELFMMKKETADILNQAKKDERRIIAVGTTSTRVIESVINKYGYFKECTETTKIFIYPGYVFKGVDALITNFHLPKSTLVMLVSALSSRDYILSAYKHAIDNKYRFFSFGDAMFIIDKF